MSDESHARDQAKAQYESISSMVAAMELDWDRLEELRSERKDLEDDELANWDAENGEELAELTEAAGEYESSEDAERAIDEDPLSVQVRSGWANSPSEFEAEEFEILLCTGGPAVRIRGELGEGNEPRRAWIEYQDWYQPWTQWFETDQDTLLSYCRRFYYGEG